MKHIHVCLDLRLSDLCRRYVVYHRGLWVNPAIRAYPELNHKSGQLYTGQIPDLNWNQAVNILFSTVTTDIKQALNIPNIAVFQPDFTQSLIQCEFA